MRQISTTAFIGMLALAITGCPSSNEPQTTNPTPPTAPVVVQPQPPAKPPLVATNPNSAAYLAPGLIQPTNANQRTKQVAKGNRDPFAALFLPVPAPPISVGNTPNSSSAAAPQTPQTGAPTTSTGSTTTRNTSNRQSKPNSIAINNPPRTSSSQGSSSNRSATSSLTGRNSSSNQSATSNQNTPPPATTLPNNNLPPAPPASLEPELAKNVTVMGVIQIGEQTQAIVQVPSEATSRYVQVGQRLSNGQVLVKRIELNAGAEPLVILEQYGVEVSKAVGEVAPSQGTQATPTAANPLPSPNAQLPASLQNTSTPPTGANPSLPLQNTTPLAEFPAPPQNTSRSTAELPAPPQNINISGVNISAPQPLPNTPVTSTK